MKRFITVLILVVLCAFFVNPGFVLGAEINTMDVLLEPYIKVIEKVNQETGETIYIPKGEEANVYNFYKDYSLKEFELTLLDEIDEFKNATSTDRNTQNVGITTMTMPKVTSNRSIEMDIEQSSPIQYNSTVILCSTIFGTGTPITYRYQSINDLYVTWPSNYTGYHFGVTSCYYILAEPESILVREEE